MAHHVKATDARNHLNELVNRVRYGKERVIITHHNQEAAAIISRDDLELLERIEDILLGEAALEALKAAEVEGDRGLSLSELREELNRKD
jgi:prevent-host-death family protein